MTEMCRMNPHSAPLFSGDIRQLYGNAADVVPTLPDASFDRIVHDPPANSSPRSFTANSSGYSRRKADCTTTLGIPPVRARGTWRGGW